MPAPRGAIYAPTKGILAGLTFTGTPGTTEAYNRGQQARAHALGFSSYRHQRTVAKSSIFQNLVKGFTQKENQGKKLTTAQREDLLKALGERQRVETVVQGNKITIRHGLDVDFTDHSVGGSYDLYLQRIGRRTGNEEWLPGETP